MAPERVLRIWMVYVGQGDGILIQLPERNGYPLNGRTERIDVAVDGGAFETPDEGRMRDFMHALYGQGPVVLEHAVVTHHDSDHVKGLGRLLEDDRVEVERMFHNGTASFVAGVRGLPATGRPAHAVLEFDTDENRIVRALGLLEANSQRLQTGFIVDDLAELRTAQQAGQFQGVYRDLAQSIVSKTAPGPVRAFDRVRVGSPFILEAEARLARANLDGIGIELIWPTAAPQSYGNWGETINGNSVTFRLTYGDFQMLFTGDHNEKSERKLVDHLTAEGRLKDLACDVLKVPHHASKHGIEDFFRETQAVLGVASQGKRGARSKALGNASAWEHPSEEVTRWLGGSHRVYHTQMEERRFRWADLDTEQAHEDLYERNHILIETDGVWFRIVEIPAGSNPTSIPSVASVSRGDGTRWVRAR